METTRLNLELDSEIEIDKLLSEVYQAVEKAGYNHIDQISGYLMSGDPTYITSKYDARKNITKVDRSDILKKVLEQYFGRENGKL